MIFLRESQLLHHPENMRQVYPAAQVADMAASIKAGGGVEQALLVVAAPRGKYYVVDGNLRLEGARRLGAACPPLKCEVRRQSDAEQKLTMARTEMHRYAVDPISRAAHYQRILLKEKCSVRSLSSRLGVARKVIDDHLLLLRLPPEVQDLVAAGQISKDPRVARALLELPLAAAVKLARLLAGGSSIKAVLRAAARLRETLNDRASPPKAAPLTPALSRVRAGRSGQLPPDAQPVSWPEIREHARRTCQACQVKADSLAAAGEPAWSSIAEHSTRTCGDCSLADIASACDACPQVDLLRRLARAVDMRARHGTPGRP